MFGFILALFGLAYTGGKIVSERSSGKALRKEYDIAKKKRDEFLNSFTASRELIHSLEYNTDYSDVVDDINYVFGKEYTADEIGKLVTNPKAKEFGNQTPYRRIILEIRLAKLGKCMGFVQTLGIRFCEGTTYYHDLVMYYELIQRYLAENGVQVQRIEKKVHGDLMEMNFKEFTY